MKGWIAVPRDIESHWLWMNPRHFQMWFKILLLCQWEDGSVMIGKIRVEIKRGQFVTTMRVLGSQLRCGKKCAMDFLKTLEEGGLIRKEVFQKYTLITVIDYMEFKQMIDVKPGKTTQSKSPPENRKTDRKSAHIKEDKNKEDKNISSSTSSSREEFLKIFEEIRNDGEFRTNLRTLLSQSENEIQEGIEKFLSEQKLKENFSIDRTEIRTHLTNWLRKHFEVKPRQRNNTTTNNKNDGQTEIDRRRGVTPPPSHNPGVRTTKF